MDKHEFCKVFDVEHTQLIVRIQCRMNDGWYIIFYTEIFSKKQMLPVPYPGHMPFESGGEAVATFNAFDEEQAKQYVRQCRETQRMADLGLKI